MFKNFINNLFIAIFLMLIHLTFLIFIQKYIFNVLVQKVQVYIYSLPLDLMTQIINLSIEQLAIYNFHSNLEIYQNCFQPNYKLKAKLLQKYLFIHKYQFIQGFTQIETQQNFYHNSLWTIIFNSLILKKSFFLKVFNLLIQMYKYYY